MYYLRSKAAVDPIKFTLDEKHQRIVTKEVAEPEAVKIKGEQTQPNSSPNDTHIEMEAAQGQACSLDDPNCLMCGS